MLDAVLRYKRPGYIELPRDVVDVGAGRARIRGPSRQPTSDPEVLAEAVAEAVRRIAAARWPVIIADVEIHRFGLQDRCWPWPKGPAFPWSARSCGKSVVSERHPLFVGIYEGAMGREEVTQFVESSDCVHPAGGLHDRHQPGHLHGPSRSGPLHRRHQRNARASATTTYDGVLLADFLDGLIAAGLKAPPRALPAAAGRMSEVFQLRPDDADDDQPA